jgi:sialic acid synthase
MILAVIQARMGSSRLRGKSLMPVSGLALLTRVINMVKGLKKIDDIMIATTVLPEDDPIVAVAESLGVKIFRGASLNVLERFYGASINLDENDTIVRFTADNPFNNNAITNDLLQKHLDHKNDYTHIDGLSHIVAEFINVRALREAFENGRLDNFDKEHVTPYFRKHKDLFKIETFAADYMDLRHDLDKFLTIDNREDIERFERMINELKIGDKNPVDFSSVYQFVEANYLKITHTEVSEIPVIKLAGTPVGEGYPTYIIAEIGQNHNGDIKIAKQLIDMAVHCGADAVKFQKRDIPSELTKAAFERPYDNSNSFGKTYGEHRLFLELSEDQHLELKEYANSVGMVYFCTPCDVLSVELLERIGCPFYKVASRDLTNIPLLEKLGSTGKPVIISTGMADLEDIDDAFVALKRGPESVIIMQCTSEYPCHLENVNLKAMATLRKKYKAIVGLSDHTSGVIISSAASVMGAHLIEKHITLDRTMKGTDQPGSLEYAGLKKLIQYIRAIEQATGDGEKLVNPATRASKEKLARSLTSKQFIPANTILTENMLCLKSPGTGLKWKEKDKIVGKKSLHDIQPDVTLMFEDFR